ncbi:MAG: hypothetical protein AAB532_00115, partial [Patescibacteria group bacterium]
REGVRRPSQQISISSSDSEEHRDEDQPIITPESAKEQLQRDLKEQVKHDIVQRLLNGEIDMDLATQKWIEVEGSEEEQLERALNNFRKDTRTSEDILRDAFVDIATAGDAREASLSFTQLVGQIYLIEEEIKRGNFTADARTEAWLARARQIKNDWNNGVIRNDSLVSIQDAAGELRSLGQEVVWKIYEKERKDAGAVIQPEGLEDLIGLIIHSEIPEWRPGGEKELKNEAGEVQIHNFLDWIREKVIYQHEFSPDSEIDLFSSIYIPTPYRQIGLGEMITTPRYFRAQTKDGGFQDPSLSDRPKLYEELKNHLLYEVWLFQNNHNNEVKYRINMGGNEEKAVEALVSIHMLNIFTKNKDRLYNILTLPSVDKDQVLATLEGRREVAGVGQAIRTAILAFNYLNETGQADSAKAQASPDYKPEFKVVDNEDPNITYDNMFDKVLGREGTLDFYRGVVAYIIKTRFGTELKAQIKEVEEGNKGKRLLKDQDQLLDGLIAAHHDELVSALQAGYDQDPAINTLLIGALDRYQASGFTSIADLKEFNRILLRKANIVEEKDLKKVSLNELNFFNKFGKQPYLQDLLKFGIINAIGRKESLTAQDANYAEAWAFSMTYWTGISARNDTNANGFDGLSKIMNFRDYRIRQAQGRGRYGDLDTIYGGVNRLCMTMWEALRVRDEKTGVERPLLEVLQGGWGSDIDLSRPIDPFNFSEGSQEVTLSAQQYTNALTLYKFFMKSHGLNFDKFLGLDRAGRLVITNYEEESKVRAEYIKALRYAFDMGTYFFDRNTRLWSQDENGKAHVETKPLGQFMFGKGALSMGMYSLDRKSAKTGKPLFDHSYRRRTNYKGQYIRINSVGEEEVVDKEEMADQELQHMSRNLAGWEFAVELWRHRRYNSGRRLYSLAEFDAVEEWLGSIPLEIKEQKGKEEGDLSQAIVITPYLSTKELEAIRKKGHVDPRQLEAQLAARQIASSGSGILGAIAKEFIKNAKV